jgi:Uri superfamily endonuclease
LKGTYVLLIELTQPADIVIGRKGRINFKAGYYAYVGSALNSLEKRVERHLCKEKKIHWHVDYLLEKAEVRHVIYAETDKKVECKIAGKLATTFEGIKDFGCSDCKCRSHLFYGKDLGVMRSTVIKVFKTLGLKPLEKVN